VIDFAGLLRRTVYAIASCAVLVTICYYFVDRPVAFFVHGHQVPRFHELRWLTEPPPLVQSLSPLVLVLLLVRRAGGPWRRWQHVLLVACVSVIVADQFRESMGGLFCRYWPETWHNDNPSLIGSGAYGFRPFHFGDDVGSFPSGHSARIMGFGSAFWIAMPRMRWLCAIVALPMLIALVGMNYHFVGDVIAGSVLGAIVGTYSATLACVVPGAAGSASAGAKHSTG
jgi:membrane-associated phospholipid phosphatase